MKVLFLDVDGVLNHKPDYAVIVPNPSVYILNGILVERLQKVLKDTGALVVLSSTWRKDTDGVDAISAHLPIHDVTPVFNGTRGEQIQHWLKENPGCTKYAIVDDDSDMLDEQLTHFVQTEFEHGLTRTLAYRLTRKLGDAA